MDMSFRQQCTQHNPTNYHSKRSKREYTEWLLGNALAGESYTNRDADQRQRGSEGLVQFTLIRNFFCYRYQTLWFISIFDFNDCSPNDNT